MRRHICTQASDWPTWPGIREEALARSGRFISAMSQSLVLGGHGTKTQQDPQVSARGTRKNQGARHRVWGAVCISGRFSQAWRRRAMCNQPVGKLARAPWDVMVSPGPNRAASLICVVHGFGREAAARPARRWRRGRSSGSAFDRADGVCRRIGAQWAARGPFSGPPMCLGRCCTHSRRVLEWSNGRR